MYLSKYDTIMNSLKKLSGKDEIDKIMQQIRIIEIQVRIKYI